MQLSISSARALHLAAQGLLTPITKTANKDDVLNAIRQMAALQIDTINVVARSPYLVLWSRLGEYQNCWLDELLEEGKLFEFWAHEACFLPIEDYVLYRHQMISPQGLGWKYNHKWLKENASQVDEVRQHIHNVGATRSADFDRKNGKSGGWWEWKPEKRALELLFTTGEVMVAKRHNFQRIYDLRERVHPKWKDKRDLKKPNECQTQQVLQAVKALGISKASWVADYFRMGKLEAAIHPKTLAQQGLLLTIKVEGWEQEAYVHPHHAEVLQLAVDGKLTPTATRILSPFDPIVWDRKRALELFNFDYKLECYTPAQKRKYGYFTLPILRRGAIVARMDAKAHRKDGIFEIKSLHLEQGTRVSQVLVKEIIEAIRSFSEWHKTPEIRLLTSNSENFFDLFQIALKKKPSHTI